MINIGEPKRTEPNRKELNPINNINAAYNGDEDDAGDDNQNGYAPPGLRARADAERIRLYYISLSPPHSHLYLLSLNLSISL